MTGTTTKTATIPMNNETKYGVAVWCNNPSNPMTNGVKVIQATSTELANPKIVCSTPSFVLFTVNVDISDIQVNNDDQVCVNDNLFENNNPSRCSQLAQGATSAEIRANLEPGDERDLLITLKDSQGSVKVAKVKRRVNVSPGGSTRVSLGTGDEEDSVSFRTMPAAPEGYIAFPGILVSYLSANGTASGSVNVSPTSYRPVSGFGGGDLYGAFIIALGSNAGLTSIQLFKSGTPSLEFPEPWRSGDLTVTQTAHPKVTGLDRNDQNLKGYAISLSSGQFNYTAILSKAWLGDATEYTLPDLSNSNLLGYPALQNGDFARISATALLSNKTALATSFISNTTNPPDLGDGDYLRLAEASTNFTVGGGNPITLP